MGAKIELSVLNGIRLWGKVAQQWEETLYEDRSTSRANVEGNLRSV